MTTLPDLLSGLLPIIALIYLATKMIAGIKDDEKID